MTDFPLAFRAFLNTQPRTNKIARLVKILDGPESRKRTRQVRRMEWHARVECDFHEDANIDWSTIDWATIGLMILKVLLALLPLILMLGDDDA